MKLSYLWRGLPGHPIHPPLTDATIGIYTFAMVAAVAEVLGITEDSGAYGWWIALIAGLIFTVPTALTGLADWLTITWRSELWWTATYHLSSMVTATLFFALAAIFGHAQYTHGHARPQPEARAVRPRRRARAAPGKERGRGGLGAPSP
jgi:hypothetical protein